jgi:uncharacterized membrane protein
MIDPLWAAALVIATVGSACVSGALFAFSAFVMPALWRIPAPEAVRAMQSINVFAERAPFGLAILAPMIASMALSIRALNDWHGTESALIIAGTVLYIGVGFGVSFAVNIPLNRRLAGVTPDPTEVVETWRTFASPWVRANHVRTAGGLLASAAFTLASLAT